MEKSVGSVDIEELRKAREELNRERGIVTDPNMYKNYNPNRTEESSNENSVSSNDEEKETVLSEAEDDELEAEAKSFIDSLHGSLDSDDEVEDDFSEQGSNTFDERIPEPERKRSSEELDKYDAFSAFEVNDGKVDRVETNEQKDEETQPIESAYSSSDEEESDDVVDADDDEVEIEAPYYEDESEDSMESENEYESTEDEEDNRELKYEDSDEYEEDSDERLYENNSDYAEDVDDENLSEDESDFQTVDDYDKLGELMQKEALPSEQTAEEVVDEIEDLYEDNIEEIQRPKKNYPPLPDYSFVDIIALDEFKDSHKLSFLLGKDEDGENVYGNLRDFYNMVIFGKESTAATNVVHSTLLSLILKNTIEEINFVICDSKNDSKFEAYNSSSYMYFNRIAKTNKEILDTLIEVGKELEERYKLLASVGVKSIEQYNVIAKNDNLKPLPYLLTVFNNYSKAVQLTESDKINSCLYQILKLGRIVGLYLIIVANGPIRSDEVNYNLPTRIAFKTEEEIDSVTTLGEAGAESLMVDDEFLYSTVDAESTTHIKAPMLTQVEIELLVQNIEE